MEFFNNILRGFDSIRTKSEGVFYGKIYPVILSFIIFLFWIADLQYCGFAVTVAVCFFLLVTGKDLTPVFPPLFMLGMCFRDTSIFSGNALAFVFVSIFALGVIINAIRFPFKKVVFDKVFWSIALLTLAMLIGGIFSPYLSDFSFGIPHISIACFGAGFVYFMFSNRTEPNKKTDLGRYFCFAFIVAVNLSCLQLLYGKTLVSLYGASAFPFNKDGSWANTNHIGSLIIMAIPLCCYLILEAKSIFFYILEFLFLCVCVHLSKSDGSRAIALCFLPILFFVIYRKISNKNFRAFQLFAKIFIPSVILVIAYLLLFQTDSFISFWIKSSSDSGRIPIYEKALEVFFQFPIFGVGMGHGFVLTGIETHYNGYFHSSFFHAIATMGVMGIIVYTFYYVQRIKMLAKNNTTLGLFAMVSFLMFALYAMIDNGEINIVIIYMTAIVAVVGVYNKKYHEPPLPLSLNRKAIFKK